MANIKSKRQLNIHVQLGAMNVVLYPDRMNTTASSDPPDGVGDGAPKATSNNISSPSRIRDFSFAHAPKLNYQIGLPQETFVYGGIYSDSDFDLVSPPANATQMLFPFGQRYDAYLNNEKTTQNITYSFSAPAKTTSTQPSPFIPSRSSLTKQNTPKITTYNVWSVCNTDNSFNSSDVSYYKKGNPEFLESWSGGAISQIIDRSNQAAISINSLNNKPISIRRMFALQKDALYDMDATIVYPTGYGINPVKFNCDENGKKIINPNINCSWQASLFINKIQGLISEDNNFQGVKLKWGDIDNFQTSSLNTNKIVYYELILSQDFDPTLRYYNPSTKQMDQIILKGPKITEQSSINPNVWYLGNVMLIGFDSNPLNANVIGPIEPENILNSEYTALYHVIPGGLDNLRINSGIMIECSNIDLEFKYSALACQNFINKQSDQSYDWYSDSANNLKLSITHDFSVSRYTHKLLSRHPDILNNFIYGKGLLRTNEECFYGTSQYNKKINSEYFSSSDIIDKSVKTNESSQFWSADNRIFSPYESNFNDSTPWPIKIIINNPDLDDESVDDSAAHSNINLSIIFTNPVYGAAYHGIILSMLKSNESIMPSANTLSENPSSTAVPLQEDPESLLLLTGRPSYNDQDRGAIVSPVFDFKWGNITDLVNADTISIRHSIQDESIGKSDCSFSMDNLIFTTRGFNILNLIENNMLVVTIRAGYSNNINDLPIFFQGIIESVESSRSPTESVTNVRCSDWLHHVLKNSYAFSTFALQGLRMRDRIEIALNLSGLLRYTEFIKQDGNFLPEGALDTTNEPDVKFYEALNYRQGNATSKVAGQFLSETIDTDNSLDNIVSESIQFITSDDAIAVIYNNLRRESVTNVSDFPTKNINSKIPLRKIIIENRFLPERTSANFNHTTRRFRDELKWISSPVNFNSSNLVIPPNALGQINIGSAFENDFKNLAIENLHGTVISPINFSSQVEGLYEGVYIIATSLGVTPIFHARTSDSYFLGLGRDLSNTDMAQYLTANNRAIFTGEWSWQGWINNVLDVMDDININDDSNPLQRQPVLLKNRFDFGYVGFRKRFLDDQKQTYIKTKEDLIKRGNLWAQYIRKVPQSITFSALVTKPLEHYNNFIIKHMDSNKSAATSITNSTFSEVFDEFTGFLYKSVSYEIDKKNNTIKANINGAPVPKINPQSLD